MTGNSAYTLLTAIIGDLEDLTTESKETLVAAINEAAEGGGGSYVPAESHVANVNWGDFVTDSLNADDNLNINLNETMPNNNLVVRAFIEAYSDNEDPVSIYPFDNETVKWANDTAPTFRAGHIYEIVISQAPFYLLCSWSEFTAL